MVIQWSEQQDSTRFDDSANMDVYWSLDVENDVRASFGLPPLRPRHWWEPRWWYNRYYFGKWPYREGVT